MMTMEQFEEEKARLVTLYGGTARDASGKRAQAFAQLYAKSGWTQQALAEVERLSQQRVHQLLVFGRFLLTTLGSKSRVGHEKHFRALLSRTDKTAKESERFAAVEALLQEDTTDKPSMKGLGKQIVTQFNDGKFHRISDMATAINVDMPTIRGICDRIVNQGAFQTFGERRPAPPKDGSYAYRFVKGGKKKIDLTVFRSEVQPVLDDMQMVISGPRKSDFTREAMQTAFAQLLKVLDSIAR
jgi:hypothetical protein